MKTLTSFRSLALVVGLLASLVLVACAGTPAANSETGAPPLSEPAISVNAIDVTSVDEEGSTTIDQTALDDALASVSTTELSADEIAGLLFMREEEKLARDVYLVLYEQWSMPVFQNISASEQTHMDAVKTVLDRYGLQDPAVDTAVGVFVNTSLQDLYDQLVAEGSQSLTNALQVGAAVEEIDILDLELRAAQTDKPDIQLLYENLMKGSRNHLRAFTSTLERQAGETYRPQYLDLAAYDAIVNDAIERGGNGAAGAQLGLGQKRRGN